MANTETCIFSVRQESSDGAMICVDLTLYPLEALFRVCYRFTDSCYLFLRPDEIAQSVHVHITAKEKTADLRAILGEFANALIDQRVRFDIAKETGAIRELIVAQAFAEADLLDRSTSDASYLDDPKGIAS